MGLRLKTILVLTATLIILGLGIFTMTEMVLVNGFSKVEDSAASKDYSRLKDSITDQVNQMCSRTKDYAKWTAMYDYVIKPNKLFEDDNLIEASLVNLGIDFIVVIRNDGTVLSYTAKKGHLDGQSAFGKHLATKVHKLNARILGSKELESLDGLLVVDGKVVCLSTQPALKSDGTGSIHGFVMMGSVITKERIQTTSNMIHLPVAVVSSQNGAAYLEKVENKHSLSRGVVQTIALSNDVMRSCQVIDDLEMQKSVLLVVDSPRNVFYQMQETHRWLVISLVVSGLLIFATSVWLVDRVVIGRLVGLSARTAQIAESADSSLRVSVCGQDEISKLAKAVNGMLQSLQQKTQEILDTQKVVELNEHRYFQVIESTNAGVYEFNRSTNRVKINEALRRILEWDESVSEVGIEAIRERIHPDDHADLYDLMWVNLNEDTTFAIEFRIRTKSGNYMWIHMTGKRLTGIDADDIVVGSVTDITSKKQSELELLKVYQLTELSDDFIAMANLEGRVTYVNPGGVDMTNMDPHFMPEQPTIADYYPEHEHERLANEIIPIVREQGKWAGEIEFLAADRKSTILMQEVIILICDPKTNEPKCFGTVARDITAQRRAEIELAQARDSALDLARAKASFLANMSHEIRTPMNGIIGMIGLLSETHLDAEQRDYARIVKNSAESLLAIINDILDFSKIEAGKLNIEEIKFNLRDLIEETVRLLANAAHAKGIEVICRIPPEIPDICVSDPTRIRQVMTNLLGNAIKFTDAGRVVVSVEDVGQNADQPVLRMSVADTGIGIAPEKHDTIFDSFTQADSSSSRKYGGTGLGLTISKQIVGLLGGEIGLDSKLGEGSTFWFEIPVKKAGPNKRKSPVRKMANAYTVLVVDDDETNRLVYRENLRAWQIKCIECKNGVEAIELLKANPSLQLGAVLLDLQMPVLDGIQTAAAIRELPTYLNLPIILVTSSGQGYTKDDLQDMGITAYLHKPIIQSQLFDLLANVLTGEEECERELAATKKRDAMSGRRILLVEDNAVNQKVGVKSLEKLGAQVSVAGNGQEAVTMWQKGQFDLILMDCQMPVMDGFEATTEIRRLEQGGSTRQLIIAMTAGTADDDKEQCIRSGMDGFLTKPVRPDEIMKVFSECRQPVAGDGEDANVRRLVFAPNRLLEICDGDNEFLTSIVDEFESSTNQLLQELEELVLNGNLEAIRQIAHRLKGASRTIGGDALASNCEEMEICARNGVNAGLHEILSRAREAFNELMDMLRKIDVDSDRRAA